MDRPVFPALFLLATLYAAIAWSGDADRAGTGARGASEDEAEQNDARIRRGLEIAPVPLDLHGKSRARVGLGSYLVNAVGGCNDCHTNPSYAPGHDPFLGQPKKVNAAGYLAGGQLFGPFISRNLTPENGLPAGMTLQTFKQVLHTGHDIDQKHPQISPLLQVMPWPTYQSMLDSDMEAIYEYLRAIPAIKGPVQ